MRNLINNEVILIALYVITSPYQYIIARSLSEKYKMKDDLIILNHFNNAKLFSNKLKKINKWKKIYFK